MKRFDTSNPIHHATLLFDTQSQIRINKKGLEYSALNKNHKALYNNYYGAAKGT